jgi:ABC-2 type transport system ATP-binding protein
MNVLEYLEYAGRLQGIAPADMKPRIREMVDVCGIGEVRHKDIGELSKGYRQRVGLAQAMIHDPDVLILDEPTSGLDPNQIVEIRKLIRRLGSAKTVILSTHILPEVQATCDRVVIINEGVIVADGSPEQLQHDFRGTEMVTLELKADVGNAMTEVFPKLQGIEHVESVEYLGNEGPVHRFIVHATKGQDIREQLFRQAVAERWILMGMTRNATSLEEVFHKLTMGVGQN